MSREFQIIREVDLPAAPGDVWTAITAETAAWQFPTGMEIPAGASPPDGAPVTTWDPPNRLVIRMESPDGTFNALDYTIEARAGGTAHLRYVHSGILADDWEDQYDAIDGHTDFYLHTLGQYLQHFNGRPVTYVGQPSAGIEGPASAGTPDAMHKLRAALGIGDGAAVGHAVHADLGGAGSLDGVIDYLTPHFLGIRSGDGLWRFFGRNHFGSVVGMSAHIFRDDVDSVATEAALKSWLDDVYARAPSPR
ncbi:MAG: SRPBCC family protein [Solirubrobacteraceae bacterium]